MKICPALCAAAGLSGLVAAGQLTYAACQTACAAAVPIAYSLCQVGCAKLLNPEDPDEPVEQIKKLFSWLSTRKEPGQPTRGEAEQGARMRKQDPPSRKQGARLQEQNSRPREHVRGRGANTNKGR